MPTLAIFANTYNAGEIYVYFNDQRMDFDQPPVIVNDRTMVPFRAIFEAFGAEIQWNQEQQRVTADHPTMPRIVLDIGSDRAFVSGQPYYLDAAPFVAAETSRTLVPIRFISEVYGADVRWDNDARNVIITAGPYDLFTDMSDWIDLADDYIGVTGLPDLD